MPEKCVYCSTQLFGKGSAEVLANPECEQTRDHIIPRFNGPRYEARENVRPSCLRCNRIKGHAPVELFAYFMRQKPVGKTSDLQNQMLAFVYDCARAGFGAALDKCRPGVKRASAPMVTRGSFTKRDLKRKSKK